MLERCLFMFFEICDDLFDDTSIKENDMSFIILYKKFIIRTRCIGICADMGGWHENY